MVEHHHMVDKCWNFCWRDLMALRMDVENPEAWGAGDNVFQQNGLVPKIKKSNDVVLYCYTLLFSTVCYWHGAFQGLWLIQLFNIAIFHSYGYVNQRLNPTRLIIPKRVSTGQGPLRWCPSWPSVMVTSGLWSLMVDQITTAGVVPNQYANYGAGIIWNIQLPLPKFMSQFRR